MAAKVEGINNEKYTKNELVRLFTKCWIEDQFFYDLSSWRNKMMSCNVLEYYTPSSFACFVLDIHKAANGFQADSRRRIKSRRF